MIILFFLLLRKFQMTSRMNGRNSSAETAGAVMISSAGRPSMPVAEMIPLFGRIVHISHFIHETFPSSLKLFTVVNEEFIVKVPQKSIDRLEAI